MEEQMQLALKNNVIGFALSSGLRGFAATLRENRVRQARVDRAYNELQGLSDRELVEYGLYRSDFADMARRTVEAA